MPKLTIIFGPMGVGKTTYARQMSKSKGMELLRFDEWFSGKFNGELEPFLDWLASKVNSSDDLIIDGWFAWDGGLKNTDALGTPIKWIYLFAPRWVIEDRYRNRVNKDIDAGLELSFRRILSAIPENCAFVDATDFDYEVCSREEYERRFRDDINTEDMIELLRKIGNQERYQNIQLPLGFSTGGYTDCERSWKQIEGLVDWKGKTVLDVGCHWGYFCHEIKARSAAEVVGTDISDETLAIAKEIRRLKKSAVVFKFHDIDEEDITREYDVVLLLNTLHHLRHPFHALTRIFSKTEIAIFEIELPHDQQLLEKPIVEMGDPIKLSNDRMGGHLRFSREMMIRVAAENGHALKREAPSLRPNRTILMFQRD